ncbi:MAG: RNA polymerase sigma factor [Pseudobacter sp.]|uniref:RNA polymerase sigma factor n=1 Tax=Pseudobacter sp. TaxID=2045420 RepID=UPI003F7F9B28
MKPVEIADKLGIPVGTVKNNLSAALKEIRKGLEAAGHDPLILIFLIVQLP